MAGTTSGTAGPFAERRRLPRLRASIAVQYRDVLKPSESFSGSLSRDISASGVRLVSFRFLAKQSRLVLQIFMPGLLRPMRVIARVIWMRRQRFNDFYECGIQFLEIASEDQDTIADFVERGVIAPPSSS